MRRWLVPALIVYWVALFIGTHIPLPEGTLPGESDKLAHFGAYAGLAFLLSLSISPRREGANLRHYGLVWGIAAAYAIVEELLQIPVGRDADILDWLADCIGAVIGLTAAWLARRFVLQRWI